MDVFKAWEYFVEPIRAKQVERKRKSDDQMEFLFIQKKEPPPIDKNKPFPGRVLVLNVKT